MDRAAFRSTLFDAVKRLPREVIDDVGKLAKKLIVDHRASIEAVMPALIAELTPLIQVVMMEKITGILDFKALEADVMAVLDHFGIKEV